MPKIISIDDELAYLRALRDTGNATLAAERAGVSRSWAYVRRKQDARFARLFREMVAAARERLQALGHSPPLRGHSIDPNGSTEPSSPLRPPIPAGAGTGPSLSRKGRGANKRVRVNRERRGGWTAALEQRFLAALAATRDVPLAALQVGISTVSAYRHRLLRPGFAARWREALADDETFGYSEWVGTLICMLDGEPVPPDYPVQTIGIGDVIRLYERSCGIRRGRPMR